MFTGIVQSLAQIVAIEHQLHFRTYAVHFPSQLLQGLVIGASVAHNGCCLTVTAIEDKKVSFDLIKETLSVTNLALQQVGDWINIERSATLGSEIGGHLISGHITCMSEIVRIISDEYNRQMWFCLPEPLIKYVLPKGFIAIDGVSLTVGEVLRHHFSVNLIPETLKHTTLGRRRLNDKVNIELDAQTRATVDTVERIMKIQRK